MAALALSFFAALRDRRSCGRSFTGAWLGGLCVLAACARTPPDPTLPTPPAGPAAARTSSAPPQSPSTPAGSGEAANAAAAEAALPPDPAFDLPAGRTLGDLLPPLPAAVPRVALGPAADLAQPEVSCADQAPDGFALARRIDIALPPGATPTATPAGMLEVCLFQTGTERASPHASGGRAFHLVAAWPGKVVTRLGVHELDRPARTLPPERRAAGHDATSWGGLIATGHPGAPALAVVSARFCDGELGEQWHWRREAYVLRTGRGEPTWQRLDGLAFETFDAAHLDALCRGKSDSSPADRAAGALQLACDRLQRDDDARAAAAVARAEQRTRRLRGAMPPGPLPQDDPDPQAAWLAQARRLLDKGKAHEAFEVLLRVDMACGEAVDVAHEQMAAAVRAAGLAPARPQPAQGLAELCEPLPDKPAPKRPRTDERRPPPAPR
ncbi:MAG: hypothetical protein EXR79_07940 [Myxococcales bacterium]|nr:hypothetical protein [Myxococcales bacterium]